MRFRQYPRLCGAFPTTGSRISQLSRGGQIRGIGNRIRHEYFRVDDAILWEIITKDIHALKTVMEGMLARHASDGPTPKS